MNQVQKDLHRHIRREVAELRIFFSLGALVAIASNVLIPFVSLKDARLSLALNVSNFIGTGAIAGYILANKKRLEVASHKLKGLDNSELGQIETEITIQHLQHQQFYTNMMQPQQPQVIYQQQPVMYQEQQEGHDATSSQEQSALDVLYTDDAIVPQQNTLTNNVPDNPHNLIEAHKGHILIASETGTGKTVILLGAIEYLHKSSKGEDQWLIIDPKSSPWLGMEDGQGLDGQRIAIYPDLGNPRTFDAVIKRLDYVAEIMSRRKEQRNQAMRNNQPYNPRPIRLIVDEWLVLCKIAAAHSKKSLEYLKERITYILFMGREDSVFLWLCGQSHLAGDLGLSTGERGNLAVIALGRDGKFAAIQKAIRDNWLIPFKEDRDRLVGDFAVLSQKPYGVLYCSLGGHNLYTVPDVDADQIKRKRVFSYPVQSQPTAIQDNRQLLAKEIAFVDSNEESDPGFTEIEIAEPHDCPYCGSGIKKHGTYGGKQRYMCLNEVGCGKTFS